MKKKIIKTGILASALAGCLVVGGISAFFTDHDSEINTFTVGKVEIDLLEPSWVPPTDITPLQEFPKDPQVKNTGINDAYIFMEVTVPYANVITANEDGSRNEKADTELFSYHINEGWEAMPSETVKDETQGTVTYYYAYSAEGKMTAVKKDETTVSLFDEITFVNIVEEEGMEGKTLDVTIQAYAIQTKNLGGSGSDGDMTPEAVWGFVEGQSSAVSDPTS